MSTVSTDLHTQLDTAIRARLELARAASGPQWPYMRPEAGPVSRFIDAMSPATVIRMCERDLAVLERHASVAVHTNIDPAMPACQLEWGDGDGWVNPWPCADIRDMAVAYGLLILECAAPNPSPGRTADR